MGIIEDFKAGYNLTPEESKLAEFSDRLEGETERKMEMGYFSGINSATREIAEMKDQTPGTATRIVRGCRQVLEKLI